MPKTFTYKITEHIATLSQNGNTSKELNIVSFAGAEPKYDLRTWYRNGGEEKPLKGCTLSEEEVAALKATLNALDDIPDTRKRSPFGIFKGGNK